MSIMWSIVISSNNDYITRGLLFDNTGEMIIGVLNSYSSISSLIIITLDAQTGSTIAKYNLAALPGLYFRGYGSNIIFESTTKALYLSFS